MSQKDINIFNNKVNNKKIHSSKQSIALNLVNANQIANLNIAMKALNILLASNVIILLERCIILPQMSGSIKYFDKWKMSFMIEDNTVLEKHIQIWNKGKKTLNIKFYSTSA